MKVDSRELVGVTLISWYKARPSRMGNLELRAPGEHRGQPKIVIYKVNLEELAVRAFVALVEQINGGVRFLEDEHHSTTSVRHFLLEGHSFDEVATFLRPA